jgi:biotin synthase
MVPDKLRVSIGSAAVLGLVNYKLSVPPTTAYFMSYTVSPCLANCSFCAQACSNEANREQLSRVIWPDFPIKDIVAGFKNPAYHIFERICYQVINYSGFLEDSIDIIKILKNSIKLPISIDIFPISESGLKKIRDLGVDYISIPLDGATKDIFNGVKGEGVNGPYRWEVHFGALESAVKIFGKRNVGSNIIVGLGETEADVVSLIHRLDNMGVIPILFAFTPITGTRLSGLSQPDIGSYRRIQVARHLIVNNLISLGEIEIDDGKITSFDVDNLYELLKDGNAFQTSGCPGCNRPFYNERPSGPIYNYPRSLSKDEIEYEINVLFN